jgi:selenocysteine-specific elongation factor
MILGTAGHIDHGKTALVHALTGVDTDRLPEERRRGITIELGFARWQPKQAPELSLALVDMPGHEALVRTMVAGAGGIDAVLLVIAAEDGIMPQTREHLHVCELLGLRHAVVALTKIDRLRADLGLVPHPSPDQDRQDPASEAEFAELLELAREDVRLQLGHGPFADAPIVPVSAHTGEGMAELEQALVAMARRLPARPRRGLPVLPVDRVFTLRGHGTVVTGTLLVGEIALDERDSSAGDRSVSETGAGELELVRHGRARARLPVRVRSMQVHGHDARRARAGTRTALNLANLGVDELARGDVITRGDKVVHSDRLLARVSQLGFGLRAWQRDTALQLCAGTASTSAHLVPLALADPETGALLEPEPSAGKLAIAPGHAGLVRLYLATPLAVWAGQRIILRAYSGAHAQVEGLTVGGGVILDPLPERRHPLRRIALARALEAEDGEAKLLALVVDAEAAGIDARTLAIRSGVEQPGKLLARLTRDGGPLLALAHPPRLAGGGPRYVDRSWLEALVRAAVDVTERFHAQQPLEAGVARATLEGALPGHPSAELARAAVDAALAGKLLRVADRHGSLARPGKGSLDPEALPEPLQTMLDLYRTGGIAPPTLKQIAERLAADGKQVLEYVGLLQRNHLLVRVSDDLSYAPDAHAQLLARIRAHLGVHGQLDVQALKQLTGLSRKFAVPFMEHLDHLAITRREGDRRLPGPRAAG